MEKNLTKSVDIKESKTLCEKLCNTTGYLVKHGHEINIANIAETYHTRLYIKGRISDLLSTMLITMGLIGTIVGLISVIGGLENVISNIGFSKSTMITGVQKTMAGLGTAFYTTLFGSVLGGVILRVLQNNNETTISKLCADFVDFMELKLLPLTRGPVQFKLTQLQEQIDNLSLSLQNVVIHLKDAHKNMDSLLKMPVHSKLEGIAYDLKECIVRINEISR